MLGDGSTAVTWRHRRARGSVSLPAPRPHVHDRMVGSYLPGQPVHQGIIQAPWVGFELLGVGLPVVVGWRVPPHLLGLGVLRLDHINPPLGSPHQNAFSGPWTRRAGDHLLQEAANRL